MQTLLDAAERLLVDHPELMRAFFSSDVRKEMFPDCATARATMLADRVAFPASLRDQIDMMILVYLNVFEAAYDVFHETGPDSRWKSWQRTIKEFTGDCVFFEATWDHYGRQYDSPFKAFIDRQLKVQVIAK
ncbi:MAG: hypothetical protein ACYCVL_01475 [Gemmatimonadaceae bacterium]